MIVKSIVHPMIFLVLIVGSSSRILADELILRESGSIIRVDLAGHASPFVATGGSIQVLGQEVFCAQGKTVNVYNPDGALLRSISVPADVVSYINFVVLPDRRMAFLDNHYDAIYFTAPDGTYLKTVPLFSVPDQHWQNMDGVVVNHTLVISENGNRQVVAIDLASYNLSIFRDLQTLHGSLGPITYAGGSYYIAQAQSVLTFMPDSSATELVAKTPVGNITGIAAAGGRLFVVVNGVSKRTSSDPQAKHGVLYELHPKDGTATVILDNLDYPEGLAALCDQNPQTRPIIETQKRFFYNTN